MVAVVTLEPGPRELRARAGTLQAAHSIGRTAAGGATLEELRLVGSSGLEARCSVRSPAAGDRRAKGSTGRHGSTRRPGFLIAGGYETGRRAVTFPDVTGVVLIACDYPVRMPEDPGALALVRSLPRLRQEVLDTPATLLLALDYLASRPDVDAAAIGAVGGSVGVPPVTVAAALDPRVRAVALFYGGGDLGLLFAHNLDLGSGLANRLARPAVEALTRPVEPTRYAGAISPRPVLAVNAREDPFIPLSSALALHRALREPKEIRWLELDHFGAFFERELLAQLTALALEWFAGRGLPVPPQPRAEAGSTRPPHSEPPGKLSIPEAVYIVRLGPPSDR